MVYVILALGIICVFFGIKGLNKADKTSPAAEETGKKDDFTAYLSDSMLLKKLDSIEEKLDLLCADANTDASDIGEIPEPDSSEISETDSHDSDDSYDSYESSKEDINEKIAAMRDKGAAVEDIASCFGMTKGEVLLRLGMKR